MAVTLEQVEKLKEKANVSYEEAKAVLERHGGDILEALIELERKGKSDTASKGGFYTTQAPGAPETEPLVPVNTAKSGKQGWQREKSKGWSVDGDSLLGALRDLVRRSITNQVEVWRGGRIMTTIPILVLILLVVFFFWVTIPLLIVGLFFGCRYRFSGPDLGREEVNRVMDQMSDTVDDMKQSVKSEFQKKK